MNRITALLTLIVIIVSSSADAQEVQPSSKKITAISFVINASGTSDAYDNPETTENEAADGICADENGQCTITAALQEADNMASELNLDAVPVHLTFAISPITLPAGTVVAPHPGSVIEKGRIVFMMSGDINIQDGMIDGTEIENGSVTLTNSTIKNVTAVFEPLFGIAGGNITLVTTSTMDSCSIENGTVSLEEDGNTVEHSTIHFTTAAGAGISVVGNGNTVVSNTVTGSKTAGVIITGSDNDITGNRIGINTSGTAAANAAGLLIAGEEIAGGNTVEDNIISGNTGAGITVSLSDNNIIRNNKIGTNVAGTLAVPNGGHGIDLIGTANTLIEKNTIAGNSANGIVLSGSGDPLRAASDNIIKFNYIGANEFEVPIPNGGNGVAFVGHATDNIIGSGTGTDLDTNVIANNILNGILVQVSPTHKPEKNIFRRNRMYNNGTPGILLQPLTQGGIDRPVIDSVQIIPGMNSVVVHGKSKPQARIDVYAVSSNTLHYGEGKDWLGKGNADGSGIFAVNVGPQQLQCDKLTVLQTDELHNTSAYAINKGILPTIVLLTEQCAPSLFGGIAYANNKYTVHIDWKNLPKEGEITFNLNGHQKPGTILGDIATVDYNMNQTVVGQNTLTWQLTSCSGQNANGLNMHTFCGNPVPSWLEPVTAHCSSGHMSYTHSETFPDVPGIAAALNIPPSMAFVGGLALSFAGAPSFTTTLTIPGESTPFEATAAFAIGDFRTNVSAGGTASTVFSGCNDIDLTGSITLTAGVAKDYSYGFSFGTIPCPSIPGLEQVCQMANAISHSLRVGATLSGEITGTANLAEGIEITGGSGGATLALTPFLDLFPFHARGTGQIAFSFAIPSFSVTSITPSLVVTISESITGSSHSWSFPSLSMLADDVRTQGRAKMLEHISFPYRPISIPGIAPDTTLEHGIAWNAKPSFAAGANGVKAFAWVTYRLIGGNMVSDIALKYFDGTQWKPAASLTSDDNIDRNPAVAIDNSGNIIVCWERNNLTQPYPDSQHYAVTIMKNFDIRYAVISSITGAQTSAGTLGQEDRYDALPKLSRGKDGSVMLAWQTNSGENAFGTDAAPARIAVAREWNSSQWTAFDTIPVLQSKMFQWDLAVHDGQNAIIALAKDTQDDLSSGNDWEIFTIKRTNGTWAAENRLTTNSVIEYGVNAAYMPDGTPVVTWMRDTSVVGSIGAVSSSQEIWFANAGMGFMNNAFAVGKDTMALIWNEGTSAMISTASITQRHWSQPKFIHFTTNVQRSVSAQFDMNGSLHIGFQKSPYSTQTNQFSDSGSLQLISLEKISSPLDVGINEPAVPKHFTLLDAYPNPFNATATIKFILPKQSYTVLTVTNILGHEVARLVDGELMEGEHSFQFTADRFASGVYFYTLRSGSIIQTKRMMLVK